MTVAERTVFFDSSEAPAYRFSVERYHELVASGLFTKDDRFELIRGLLVTKLPINPPHAETTLLVAEALRTAGLDGFHIRSPAVITTGDSEPEPDVAVVRGSIRDFGSEHPSPSDVLLVIEVSDTTLKRDHTLKLPLYADARIANCWIINLAERMVECYRKPDGFGDDAKYADRTDFTLVQSVPILDKSIPVAAMLPG